MSRPKPQQTPSQTYSMNRPNTFTKLDLKPRRYHAYNVLLFILGSLFPPLAVAARFGIGSDFWLNLLLTICGYIPGHGHNFYIQNIRNNKNRKRTPKWAIRYGLVDDSEIKRKEARSQWAGRYNDRLPNSTLENRPVEEGQVPDREPSITENGTPGNEPGHLWDQRQDEHFYGERRNASGSLSNGSTGRAGRWHYPANFDDAEIDPNSPIEPPVGKGKKSLLGGGKKKKDRWALSEDARKAPRVPDGEYVGVEAKKKKDKKVKRRKKNHDGVGDDNVDSYSSRQRSGSTSTNGIEEPEDPVGGLYGNRSTAAKPVDRTEQRDRNDRDLFEHEF